LLDAAEGRQVQGRLAGEPQPLREGRGAGEGVGGVAEAVLGVGDGAEHGLGVDHAPGVPDRGQEPHRLGGRAGGGAGVAQHDRPEGAEQQAGRRLPRQVEPAVHRLAGRGALKDLEGASLLVAAALVSHDSNELLARAAATATTTRDRQLVAITAAHLAHDEDLLDALVRDHLADHPDSILAAWIATQHQRPA
jgi:hypothetical protein